MYMIINTLSEIILFPLFLYLSSFLPKKKCVPLLKPKLMAAAKVIPPLIRYKAEAPTNKRRKSSAYIMKNVTMNSIFFSFFGANIRNKTLASKYFEEN